MDNEMGKALVLGMKIVSFVVLCFILLVIALMTFAPPEEKPEPVVVDKEITPERELTDTHKLLLRIRNFHPEAISIKDHVKVTSQKAFSDTKKHLWFTKDDFKEDSFKANFQAFCFDAFDQHKEQKYSTHIIFNEETLNDINSFLDSQNKPSDSFDLKLRAQLEGEDKVMIMYEIIDQGEVIWSRDLPLTMIKVN